MSGRAAGRHASVIGGGIVGVATALSLRRAGLEVTLIERDEPGMGTSFGNAGLLSVSGCVPIATPGLARRVPQLMLDPMAPLAIRWQYLPRLAPWLWRFLRASAPERVEAISIALASLIAHGQDSYRDLLGPAAFADLVRDGGMLYVYETDRAFDGAKASHELRRRRGVKIGYVPPEQLRQREPTLAPIYRHGMYVEGTKYVRNPLRLTQTLVERFRAEGGEVLRAGVERIEIGRDGRPRLETTAGARAADRVVIAAGAWSKALARQCGARVPLDTERGYHVMLPRPGVMPRIALISGDHDFAITPMEHGLRLAGTVELGGLHAKPNYARAELLLRQARRMFPRLEDAEKSQWMGFRPSVPDSLPVIGPVPGSDRVYLAFGHGHLGLTFGAITGRLIADLVTGRPPIVDPTPYSPARFAS